MRASLIALACAAACGNAKDHAPPPSASAPPPSAPAIAAPPVPPPPAPVPAPDAAAAAPDATAEDDITAREALGPLKLGLGDAEVKKLLGEPKIDGKPIEEGATGMFVVTWRYPGVELNMTAETAKGPWSARLISVTAPSSYGTLAGIKIGSPRAAVEKAYKRSEESGNGPDAKDQYLVGSVYNGLLFTFKKGAVAQIAMGPFAF